MREGHHMDVLCTDKTGTITIGRVVLERHLDIHGDDSDEVLDYAFLNSYYQTGLKNMLDVAVLEHREVQADLQPETAYRKIDEIPFDFVRRRLSVVVHEQGDGHLLICKGAVEELLGLCTAVQDGDRAVPLDEGQRREALGLVQRLNEDGFRVLALGLKRLPAEDRLYSVADEGELALLGFLAFLDPAKETAQQVRGVALHADADHPRDPHEQDPVHPEPGQPPYSIACAEEKGRPSKWVTPRALRVLSAPPGPGNGVRRSPGRAPSMVPGCGSAAARRCVIRA